jgi:hypothetical protein
MDNIQNCDSYINIPLSQAIELIYTTNVEPMCTQNLEKSILWLLISTKYCA